MRRLYLVILACFLLVNCTAVSQPATVPDPTDAISYQVLNSSSLPAIMDAYELNMYAMLRAKGYRISSDITYVRVLRPLDQVASAYDQAAVASGWVLDTPLPAREQRILRTYRLGTQLLIVTLFAEANSRDGVVVMRLTADR